MKAIKHIVIVVVWALLGLYASLMALSHMPSVQAFVGGAVARALSDKLGTRVQVGRVDIGMLNRLIVDDVVIFDQQGEVMMRSARLSVKIDYAPLAEGKVSISSAQVFSTHLNLYQAKPEAKPNFQFALDSLASRDTTSQSTLSLRINSLIMRHSSVAYNKRYEPQTPGKFSPNHINVTDISAHVILKAYSSDSLNVNLKRIALKERSGLVVSKLSLKAEANMEHCAVSDFTLAMPGTHVRIDELMATYRFVDGKPQSGSLRFGGALRRSRVALADIACLLPLPEPPTYELDVAATFSGTSQSLSVGQLDVQSSEGDIALQASGWLRQGVGDGPQWQATVERLHLSRDAMGCLLRNVMPDGGTAAEAIAAAGSVDISGSASSSDGRALATNVTLATEAGHADAHVAVLSAGALSGQVALADIHLGQLLGQPDLGTFAAKMALGGNVRPKEALRVSVNGQVEHLDYKGYRYGGIGVDALWSGKGLKCSMDIDDPNASAAVAASYNGHHGGQAEVALTADIRSLRPAALNLSDRWGDANFSISASANVTASGLNDAQGVANITDFSMVSSTDTLRIDGLVASAGYEDGKHYLSLDGDIATVRLDGDIDPGGLPQSLANFVASQLPTMPGLPKVTHGGRNSFTMRANIANTDWADALFGVPLHLNQPLRLHLSVDDHLHMLSARCQADGLVYSEEAYRNGLVVLETRTDTLHCDASVTRVNDDGTSIAATIRAAAIDNKLRTNMAWANDARETFSGQLNTVTRFSRDSLGRQAASVTIEPSHINMRGAVWNVAPSHILYNKNNIEVSHFAITNGSQHIKANGKATDSAADSLLIDLSGVDVNYILQLVNFHSVEFGGLASGRACVKAPFGEVDARGQIDVDSFLFQGGRLGVLHANVVWNSPEGQIDIDAVADGGPASKLYIDGYVSPKLNGLDLGFRLEDTNIEFLHSFTSSFMDYFDATASGAIRLSGGFKALNLTGEVVADGKTRITPLNCTYWLRGDTVRFVPNAILFDRAPITDAHGNHGYLSGQLRHSNLKRLTYDLHIDAQKLLAYDFRDFGDDSFYGTVFATGTADIEGRSGEVRIDLNITPEANSSITYNVADPNAIAEQGFITWHDASHTDSTGSQTHAHAHSNVPQLAEVPSDVIINFIIDCTPSATLRLLMDSRTGDYISLNGNGTIRAIYHNNGSFNMFGTYTVDYGTYTITIQDLLKKNFTFSEGGTIVFGGNPYNATLNLQAVNTVTGVSLSDLNVGNSFAGNSIRVNCLMNIGGTPLRPQITFDLDMPSLSADETQMIRNLINSEDEMNQQVIYLLGIGRFYPQQANNATAQGDGQPSQTSLAMQSLLSGTITGTLNTLLSSVVKSSNWSLGANITTGDEGWNNAEYEGLLSGRLLNNRLLINGQFGYRDNATTANTSFIGDFDIRYLLKPNGNFAVRVYNQTNDRYFTRSSLNTQGIGLIMKKDFNGLRDLFNIRRKEK